MKTEGQINILKQPQQKPTLDQAKERLLETPTELICAINNSPLPMSLKLHKMMGLMCTYGYDLMSPDHDRRIQNEALDVVKEMSEIIDKMMEEWLKMPDWD